ncbi:MAG: hypothetical protein AUI47_07160 [Acidobacteria bacterium 13_1_40CM_2_68_5]|nr:MAG: hypothetical protein AUI47_07160 [Acidobacteria bacterium 13_1_40CM_2_68_5]
MTRRVARPTLALLMILTLLAVVAAPAAMAQAPSASPPPAETPPGRQPSVAPPYVLSLQDALTATLENNLDIVVRSYDPLQSESKVIASESFFDPFFAGTATSSLDEQSRLTAFVGRFSSNDKAHLYTLRFEDPLLTGGRYRIDVNANDDSLKRTLFDACDTTAGACVSDPFKLCVTDSDCVSSSQSKGFNAQYALTFIQPLLRNFGKTANKVFIVVAHNSLGIDEARFRQTVLDTLSAAEKAYWDLNFAIMDLKTQQAALKLAQDFLEENRIKVRVGTLAPIEITQAEAGVADREETVITGENLVRTAEDALRRVMNVPKSSPIWDQPIQPSDPPPLVEMAPDMDAAVASAQKHRPDLEQARLDLGSQEANLAFRKNQKRWGLDFTGTYGNLGFASTSYHDSFRDLKDRNQTDWSLLLSMNVPLGNRLADANFAVAEYQVAQSRYRLETLEQAARVEVRNAVRSVETNLKRVKAAQVNSRLQREKLAAEQKKFENGMSTSFQVLSFQTDLRTAESRENAAITDYNKSLVELQRVQGTLLEAKNMRMPDNDSRRTMPYRPKTRLGDVPGVDFRPAGATGAGAPAAISLPRQFTFDRRRLAVTGTPPDGADASAEHAAQGGSGRR